MGFGQALQQNFSLVFSGLEDVKARGFFLLLFSGQYGYHSHNFVELFKRLSLLHLLVLSGSQLGHLERNMSFLTSLIPGLRGPSFRVGQRALLCVVLVSFVLFAKSSPPLVRAFSMALLSLGIPRLRLELKLGLGLFFHLIFFPSHALTASFYLSWCCFLALLWVESLDVPAWLRMAILVLAAQIFLSLILGVGLGTPRGLVQAIFSNIFWVLIFERLLFPLGSLLFIVYLAVALLSYGLWGEVLVPDILIAGVKKILEGPAMVILGALKGFMYTLEYDL